MRLFFENSFSLEKQSTLNILTIFNTISEFFVIIYVLLYVSVKPASTILSYSF